MRAFPQLSTSNCTLRQIKVSDAPDLYDYFSKEEVMQYYDLDPLTSPQQAKQIIAAWQHRWEKDEGVRWGISLHSSPTLIGTIGFHNWSLNHRKTEVGGDLSPQFWNKGLMSECLLAVLEYGFVEMNFNRIEALVNVDNLASCKVLEKINMKQEGQLRHYRFYRGKFIDVLIYSYLQHEFLQRLR